jgi:hypothetical protein
MHIVEAERMGADNVTLGSSVPGVGLSSEFRI